MTYEAVIGLEIHVQLATKSKMFCRCDNDSTGATPNRNVCPVCLGMPGTLPVPNRQAVEWALKTAMALGCAVPDVSKFDRKQYFYPDLPKGYQISQYDEPLGGPGKFEFDVAEGTKIEPRSVRITRLHLEEDAGKLTHPKGSNHSLVDLNRAGTPLMEIVTEPDFRSPAEAKVFLQELRTLMRYLGVSDADMEKGHLRADANVSVRPTGQKELGTKTELKNLNSFKFVERGLQSEITRQTALLESGKTVIQETRGFAEASGETVSQRSKEEANDYRYFPEPDIPPLEPPALGLDGLKKDIPELPVTLKRRWRELGVSAEAVGVIAEDKQGADDFGAVLAGVPGKENRLGKVWLRHRSNDYFTEHPDKLPEFAVAVAKDGGLSGAQEALLIQQMGESGQTATEHLKDFSPVVLADISSIVDEAIAQNAQAVADFKAGNENSLNVLVGYVMKQTKGSANPTSTAEAIRQKLE